MNTPFLKETLKHWKAAQKQLSKNADHTEIYKYQKKLDALKSGSEPEFRVPGPVHTNSGSDPDFRRR